jgi:hypothetical protein
VLGTAGQLSEPSKPNSDSIHNSCRILKNPGGIRKFFFISAPKAPKPLRERLLLASRMRRAAVCPGLFPRDMSASSGKLHAPGAYMPVAGHSGVSGTRFYHRYSITIGRFPEQPGKILQYL